MTGKRSQQVKAHGHVKSKLARAARAEATLHEREKAPRGARAVSRRAAVAQGIEAASADEPAAMTSEHLLVTIEHRGKIISREIRVAKKSVDKDFIELGFQAAAIALRNPDSFGGFTRADVPLTAAEDEVLRRGGFRTALKDSDAASERGNSEYMRIIQTGLTPDRAARLLRVDPSRVRQRLGDRTLYGIKDGRNWVLPAFQFEGHGTIPGCEQLFANLPETLHPVAVARWFLSPHSELIADDKTETALSPREWLIEGRPVSRVVELAEFLSVGL